MKTWVRKTLSVGVLAAGALLFAPAAAQADTAQISAGNDGVLMGNQAFVPVQVPVNVCGNGVGAVIGLGVGISGVCANGAALDVDHNADRARKGKKESSRTEDTAQISWGNDGVANGNQAYVPIQVPVNVCGNGVGAVIGLGVGISGVCSNGAALDVDHNADRARKGKKESSRTEDTAQISGDNDGVLNGNQLYVPIQVPINVCGNGVGVLGIGAGISGACFNGAIHDADFNESSRKSSRGEDFAQVSGDNDGVLNGNQIAVPIQVPINVCGNGVGVLGVGVGVSGACVNGAAMDVDHNGGDNGNGNGYRDGNGHGHGYKSDRAAKQESLPLVGDLTGGLTGGLPVGGGAAGLPVAGDLGSGVKTSKINVGGVDPMALVSQVPTA